MHSAQWDPSYDFAGKKVAVIGGGSSAVQIIPSLQKSKSPIHLASAKCSINTTLAVAQLTPFLRSAVWITTGFGAKMAGPGGSNFACL